MWASAGIFSGSKNVGFFRGAPNKLKGPNIANFKIGGGVGGSQLFS